MQKLLILLLLISAFRAQAQTSLADSSAVLQKAKDKAKQDSMNNAFLAHATYPLLKKSKFSGVIPVTNPADKPDVSQQYKLVLEVVTGIKDSVEAKEVNNGLAEAGRTINLHIAAGIPLKNLHVVMIVHGPALDALLKNEAYQKKYKMDNPNLAFIKELQGIGVKMVACGQAMFFFNVKQEEMVPGINVAYSAKTAMTSYQMKGYILHAGL